MTRSLLLALALVPLAALVSTLAFDEPWWTADQRGQRRFRADAFGEAAEAFADASWRGIAHFRAKDFEAAADTLSGVAGAEAAYNRGNALVFLGRYEEAVASFERALAERPGWSEANDNRDIAASRIRGEAQVGEATEIGADDVVFDQTKREDGDRVETEGEPQELSDEALRALMLRNVRTRPGDFLRARFAFQAASAADGEGEDSR